MELCLLLTQLKVLSGKVINLQVTMKNCSALMLIILYNILLLSEPVSHMSIILSS